MLSQAISTLLQLRFAKAVNCVVRQQLRKGSCSLKGKELIVAAADPRHSFVLLQATFTLLPLRFAKAVSCVVRQQLRKGSCSLEGDQLFDIICVGIFACTVLFLRHLNAGAIYFWIKDLTQEFLKLQVIYTAVELFDKVRCWLAM